MPPSVPRPDASTMKIRELKAELASHGISTINVLEKSELIQAVNEAREAEAEAAKQKKGGDTYRSSSSTTKQDQPHAYMHAQGDEKHSKHRSNNDEIASMSIKQLKMELENFGISPSQFFEKGDMQDALRSAKNVTSSGNEQTPQQHAADAAAAAAAAEMGGGFSTKHSSKNSDTAPPSVFPASLSESFGQPSATRTNIASTPPDSHPKKQRQPAKSAKASDQYSWCNSKDASDVKSSTRRHSNARRGKPACHLNNYTSSENGGIKRMPQSFIPVDTFDSGTAGGEPMGGGPGTGLGAVFSDSPTDGHTYATKDTETATTFVRAPTEKAPERQQQQHSQRIHRGGNVNYVKKQEYASAPSQLSPSSVANNNSFVEQDDARPEWLQM